MASPPEPGSPSAGRSRQPDDAVGSVRKCGYLRKLKHGHKRFFVLRAGAEEEAAAAAEGARLEYYESEKKWRGRAAPRRAVGLAACLALHKRADAKHRHLLALYGREESWALAAESAAERDAWFEALRRLLRPAPGGGGGAAPAGGYGEVWQVRLKARGLGGSCRLTGVHRLCLAARWLALVRPPGERPALTLQLAAVRRCGHAESCFFLELGRSAAPGPGELWMQADDAVAAQHIHESVLRAMRALRQGPDARPRSKSHSAAAPGPPRHPPPRSPGRSRTRTASEGDAAPAAPGPRKRTRSLTAPDEPEEPREPEVGSAGSSGSSSGGSWRGPAYVPMSPSSVSAPRRVMRARPSSKGSSESSPEDWVYMPMGGPGTWRAAGSPDGGRLGKGDYVPMAPSKHGPAPASPDGFGAPDSLSEEENRECYMPMRSQVGMLDLSTHRQAGMPFATRRSRTESFLSRLAGSRPSHLCLGNKAPLPQKPQRPSGDYVSLWYSAVPAGGTSSLGSSRDGRPPSSPLSSYMNLDFNGSQLGTVSVGEGLFQGSCPSPGQPEEQDLKMGVGFLPTPSPETEDYAGVAFSRMITPPQHKPESPPVDSPVAGLERLRISEAGAFLFANPPPDPNRGAKVIRADPQGRRRHSSETFSSTTPVTPISPSFAHIPKRHNSASEENVSLRKNEGLAEEHHGSPMCRETSAGFQNGLNYIAVDVEGGRLAPGDQCISGVRHPLVGGIRDTYASLELLTHNVKEATSVKVC